MQFRNRSWSIQIIQQGLHELVRGPNGLVEFTEPLELPESEHCLLQRVDGEVHRLSIGCPQHGKSDYRSLPRNPVPSRQEFADGDEVAERLRHLLTLDLQKAVVHPDLRHASRMER